MIVITNQTILAKNIKKIRQSLGMSMEEFGKEFETIAHKSLVSKWEKGLSKPNNERLKRIAELGDLSVNQLLYGDFLNKLEDITHNKIVQVLEDNFLSCDEDLYKELRNSVSGIILSMYKRGEDGFDSNLFEDLLKYSLQLELDLGDRDLDSLTEFAYKRTINAQELVVEYSDDTMGKEFLKDKKIEQFLFTISDKYFEILKYIDDYREKNDLERFDEY